MGAARGGRSEVAVNRLAEYYAEAAVRAQIRSYCGADATGDAAAAFVKGLGPDRAGPEAQWELVAPAPLESLDRLFAMGADISRSLWDRRNLIVHLDVDYLNADFAGEPFTHPAEVFSRLEPLYRIVRRETRLLGMPLLCLVTGRGYHFTGRVPLDAPLVTELSALVPELPSWQAAVGARVPAWLTERVDERLARAHAGLGLLIEYLAHRLMRRAAPRTPVPIVLNGTIVGSGTSGRAAVSLDFSFMGDPLDVRHIRVAFGGYQLHRLRPDIVGPRVAADVSPLVAIPRDPRAGLLPTLRARLPHHAARLARRRPAVALPEVTKGVARLLAAYRLSPLARFHRAFFQEAPTAQDAAALEQRLTDTPLPPCVTFPLERPNDMLLQPAFVQQVTRALMARGWQPRDIARVIRSRYESDRGWGNRWTRMDAVTRAEFDVRVFAGLVAAGTDEAVDFNCVSAQEKGVCRGPGCPFNLLDLRADLMEGVLA